MSMQDIVSDFVARINNSINSQKETAEVIKSKLILNICKKLTRLGFFQSFEEGEYVVMVKINTEKLAKLIRVSKPGKRVYTEASKSPVIIDGFGFNIITTSAGVLTHTEAAKQNVGGEVLMQALKA